jgi:hypothetical protein
LQSQNEDVSESVDKLGKPHYKDPKDDAEMLAREIIITSGIIRKLL